ncbi:hypothetical protein HAX54_031483 [Datura stramonium]|uniref:Uncharacterized protein n=1 Tax=Datura stramonium TaxID=4076 RepID=A0ABS8VAB8_DATST|nr:hypothetical protein [Datura stramonium]
MGYVTPFFPSFRTNCQPHLQFLESGESVSGSNPIKSSSGATVSVFDGKKVVLNYRKIFISELLNVIWGKLSGSDVDCASSLKKEVQVILEEMDDKDVDVSPLMRLVKSFFELASIYDQSLSEVREEIEKLRQKEKDLEVLFEATEKEIEEAKLGVSTAEKDFDACNK